MLVKKQRVNRDLRENILDADQLVHDLEDRQAAAHAASETTSKQRLMGIFDRLVSHGSSDTAESSADGYFQIYEGGNTALNDSYSMNNSMNKSLNQSLARKATQDQEKTNKFKQQFYESLLNKSPNRHCALDLFLLLDHENDQFLKYEELKEIWPVMDKFSEVDRGIIKTEEQLKEKFDSFGKFQMDGATFNEFIDSTEVNVAKLRDRFYNMSYSGCCGRTICTCCKFCNRKVRRKLVNEMIRKENEALHMYVYDEEPKYSKMQDFVALILAIVQAYSEVTHHITDILLCSSVYYTGMKEDNHAMWSYKFATVYIFMSISSVYLIAYSSMINMLLFKGVYEPQQIKRNNCCQVAIKMIFLSFLGPLYFIGVELVSKLMAVFAALGLIFYGKTGYQFVRLHFLRLIEFVFNLNEEQIDGLNKQRGVVQLLFESLPMIILQALIRYKVIPCEDLEGESSLILALSLFTCIINVFVNTFMIYTESKSLTEPFLEYVLNSFKARQGWIPFMLQIERRELKQAVDYGEVKCAYPVLTGPTAIYKVFKFQFSDTSLQVLTSALVKWDSTTTEAADLMEESDDDDDVGPNVQNKAPGKVKLVHAKYIMDLGCSLTYVSVNTLLHFYHLSPRHRIWVKLSYLKWPELINNAKKSYLIYKPKDSNLMQARTPSGVHLLQICVEDEKTFNPTSKQLYEDQLGLLRRYKIIKKAMEKLAEGPDADEIKALNLRLKVFQDSIEGGAFEFIQEQTHDMLCVENKMKLRELGRQIRQGKSLLNKCEQLINQKDLGEEEFQYLKNSLKSIPTIVEDFLTQLDKQTIKMQESEVIIKDEFDKYELNDVEKRQSDALKEQTVNVRERIKKDKKTVKDLMKQVVDGIKECKDIYKIMALKNLEKQIRDEVKQMQRWVYRQPDRIKRDLINLVSQIIVNRESNQEGDDGQNKKEPLTYEPNPEDQVDGFFAEIYKKSEGGKHPVKFIKKNERNDEWRHYEYLGYDIVCEAYDGANEPQGCYMICNELGQEDNRHYRFFQTVQREYMKAQILGKLSKPSLGSLVNITLQQKVENQPILILGKQIIANVDGIQDSDSTFQLRYKSLFKKDLLHDLDDFYEEYEQLLPHFEELHYFVMDNVPDFADPEAWALKKCMKALLFEEHCDPNIQDNYGEKLLNFAIKTKKLQSIEYILSSKNANINDPNQHGITPIGQAFISRNVFAIRKLLKYGANIHTKCILDPRVTRKMMTPLHYFIKRIRVEGVHVLDEQILQILQQNQVKAQTDDEKIGLIRQLCRFYSTRNFSGDPNKTIKLYLLPLIEPKDINLIEFKDTKMNNALHLFIKGQIKDKFLFVEEQIYNYMPKELSKEEQLKGIKQLLNQKNKDENDQFTPLEIVLHSSQELLIKLLIEQLVDKFDDVQQKVVMEYIQACLLVNYDHFFFRGTGLKKLVTPLYAYFPLEKKELEDLIWEKAHKDGKIDVKVHQNLHHFLGIGPWIDKKSTTGYSESREYQRDPNVELQKVTISKTIDTQNSQVGQFMRFVKAHNHGNSLAALMKKEISSKLYDTSISKKQNKEKPPNPYFEFAFTLILEMIALFDMVGDIYLMISMYQTGHTAWFTLSIFTMLSPFYVCYVPLVTFQKNRGKLQKETKFLKFLNVLSLTPFIVSYLLMMDIIYIIVSVVITPAAMLIKILTCGLIDVTNVEEKLDVLYEILFGMSDMDIKGFRRLRTISQLSFESLPQIILQCRILYYGFIHAGKNELDVSMAAILASLACALLHAIFELIFVYLEAVSCKTTVIHYFIVCFNARFGWIPFVNFFSSLAGFDEDAGNQAENLNYEGMKSQFCGIKFQMHFKFSNSSCATLVNSLSNLRDEKDPKKRMDLKIGESLDEVDFPLILDLMIISSGRINLDITEVDMLTIIEKDEETVKELTTKKSEELSLQKGYLLQRVAKLGQSSVVAVMLKVKDVYLDFSPSLLDIAKTTKNYDLAKIILNSESFSSQLAKVKGNTCYMYKLILEKNPIIQACLFSNPQIIMPEQYQFLLYCQVVDYLLAKDFKNGFSLYQLVFGGMNAKYLLRGVGDLQSTRAVSYQQRDEQIVQIQPLLDEFINKLPDKVYFWTSKHQKKADDEMQVNSIPLSIASCFAVIRDLVIRHLDADQMNTSYLGSIDEPFDLKPFDIEPKTLLNVAKLLDKEHHLISCLKPEEVLAYDKVVNKLALDKHRAVYWYRSRQNDQTQSLYKIKIAQEAKIALDTENAVNKPEFKETVVIVQERFNGSTHNGFEFKLPEEVMAVSRFQIQFEYFGGSIQLNHLSKYHQSSFEISDENLNSWETQVYVEEFSENPEDMQGFKDIISSATGGDTIQIWMQTNGYAFTRNVFCEFDVILHDGQSLKLTPVEKEKIHDKKHDDKKDDEKKEEEQKDEEKNDEEKEKNEESDE